MAGKTQGSSSTRPRSSSSAMPSSTGAGRIQCGSSSWWMRWRMPRSFGCAEARRAARLARSGERSRSRRRPPPIQSWRAACSNRRRVEVGAGRLDEHRPLDAARRQQRLQVRRARTYAGSRRARPSSTAALPAPSSRSDGVRRRSRLLETRGPRRRFTSPGAPAIRRKDGVCRSSRTSRHWPWSRTPSRCPRSSAPSCRCTALYSVATPSEPIFAGNCATLPVSFPALICATSSGSASNPTRMISPGLMPAFLIDWIAPSTGGPQAA